MHCQKRNKCINRKRNEKKEFGTILKRPDHSHNLYISDNVAHVIKINEHCSRKSTEYAEYANMLEFPPPTMNLKT